MLLWSKFWAYQLKTAWSRWDTIQRWCAIRGTTRSTNGQSSDIQPEGASNNITVVGREILPRKASNLSINSRTACSRISPYWVEWHDVSKIQRIGRSPWSNKWQIKFKTINLNYITRQFYVQNTTRYYGARDNKSFVGNNGVNCDVATECRNSWNETCSIGPVTKRTIIRFPPQRITTCYALARTKTQPEKNSRRVRAAQHRWNARHCCTPQ